MTSMTGYGYKELSNDKAVISVEIKSVNSRFLDLSVNLPAFLNPVEAYFRNLVSEKVSRGKVDVNIRVRELKSSSTVNVDSELAFSYAKAFEKIKKECGLTENNSLDLLAKQDGVLTLINNYDVESYKEMIEPVFKDSLEMFLNDRKREGENLLKDFEEKFAVLVSCAHFFTEYQPKMEAQFKELITSKFKEIVGENVDENKILSETAAMMVKYTINEEIVRFKSHLEAVRKELSQNPAPGKRLDFICQEMNREINTIGSKNQNADVGKMVITAKDALENIREQAKNIE